MTFTNVLNMKKTYFTTILFLSLIFISCNPMGSEKKELQNIQNQRKDSIFLSFHSKMDKQEFEHLINEEIKKGRLKRYKHKDIDEFIYTYYTEFDSFNFSLHREDYGIMLDYYIDENINYRKNEDFAKSTEKLGKEKFNNYHNKFQSLLSMYQKRYGSFKMQENAILKNEHNQKGYTPYDKYYIFHDENKTIAIQANGDYFHEGHHQRMFRNLIPNNSDTDKDKVELFSYFITIYYFSNESYREMREKKVKDSLQKIETLKRKKIEEKQKEDEYHDRMRKLREEQINEI